MSDLLVREGEIEFSKPIARAVLRDRRLTFGARGLFVFLWDLPKGWRPNVEHLSRMRPKGKDAIRTKLKELQSVGAMRIEAIKGADGNRRPPVLQLPADQEFYISIHNVPYVT